MEKRNFAVVGGDKRSYELKKLLKEENHNVKLFGFPDVEDEDRVKTLEEAIRDVEIVLGPVPITEEYLKEIPMETLFQLMSKDQLYICGRVTEDIRLVAQRYDIKVEDLLEREEMAVLNAIPTAEGGIQIALEEMEITIHNSNVIVLGFGRIGKVLAKMLKGIGANVYVLARKHSDISWINAYGYNPIYYEDLKENLPNMDLIFNTIPHIILDKKLLINIKEDTLIIDLASKPGGVDFISAKNLNIKAIHALGLPGKVAPISSAKFMLETIYNILEELGV